MFTLRSKLISSLLAALTLSCTSLVYAAEDEAPATPSASTPSNVVVVGSTDNTAIDNAQPGNTTAQDTPAKSTESKSWYGSAWDTAGQHLSNIWDKGDIELYIPFWTDHMPYAYTPEKRASFNSFPAGGGIGKGLYNESGNWEGIYAMEFADSHGKPQYQAGYGWIATWRPFDEQFRIGAGVTAFLFMRSDIGNYAPIPGILPMASMGYGPIDVQAAFIPGGKGDGNVLFCWAKYSFR